MFDQASADYILSTTRSVRKRLDLTRPVPRDVLEECLRIAIQAPTGGNRQGWRFVVVQDAEKRRQIGDIYKRSFAVYLKDRQVEWAQYEGSYGEQMQRVAASAIYLSEVMGEVPAMVIPCIYGRVETADQSAQAGLYGSILPATWSLMLALRARGLGSAWTTLHLRYAAEVADLLGIPDDVTQAALLPIAYFTGETFKPAKRTPMEEITFWDGWG
ncbi:MAG: nitroreductase family protein [Chloroflexota bacterium]